MMITVPRLEWLVEYSEQRRATVRQSEFFQKLASAQSKKDLRWTYSLSTFSREFVTALVVRAAECGDPSAQNLFLQHAHEEALHPGQVDAWCSDHGFNIPLGATRETLDLAALCHWSARREPTSHQVIRLNLVAEGFAYDFFSAAIPVLTRLDLLNSSYWRVHREVDKHHLRIGLDRVVPADQDTLRGRWYMGLVDHTSDMFARMFQSWI